MDPYQILGLPKNTEFNEVRARYFYLAKKHHPDKFAHSYGQGAAIKTLEEKKKNEEYFKSITVAYHQIDKNRNNQYFGVGVGGGVGNDESFSETDLANIWKQVENFFNAPEVWECMKEILDKVSKAKFDGKKDAESSRPVPRKHSIKLKLSLEDIHTSKIRKLRLFLTGIKTPIYLNINSSDIFESNIVEINNYKVNEKIEIDISIHLSIEKHKIYRLMRFGDSWDIFYDISLTWEEYIKGKKIRAIYLDGKRKEFTIAPYQDIELPIVIENEGLSGKGSLYIIVKIINPRNFIEVKEILAKINAGVMEPCLLRTKSI